MAELLRIKQNQKRIKKEFQKLGEEKKRREEFKKRKSPEKPFVPKTKPRYLPGSVPEEELAVDLKMYNNHLCRMHYIKSMVDQAPPLMPMDMYIKTRTMMEHARRLKRIDEDNKKLLKKINLINRQGGKVDTYNKNAYNETSFSKWNDHVREAIQIVTDNKALYKKLRNVESNYSRRSHQEFWKAMHTKIKHSARFPLIIFEKEDVDMVLQKQKSITSILKSKPTQHPLRPIVFMSFETGYGIKLGTIYIELYSDVTPLTCDNFKALCDQRSRSKYSYKNSIVHNIVKNSHIELGDVTLTNGKGGQPAFGDILVGENFNLKHNRAGTVSMIPVRPNEYNSIFTITLGPCNKFDNQRVVFGKIIKGFETVLKINDFGRTAGKPFETIKVAFCGVESMRQSKKHVRISVKK